MRKELVWQAKIPSVPFCYQSGEEVLAGDRILYAGEAGTIEFVTDPENPDYAWYIEDCGGGCMLQVPPFGRLFLSEPQDEEDLELVGRRDSMPSDQPNAS
jgi:hypothetical protein